MSELTEYDKIQEAVAVIRGRWSKKADVGIVLGTGLGALAERIAPASSYPTRNSAFRARPSRRTPEN